MKKSQQQIVLERMRELGEISNLWAIQNGIWRLGAVIEILRKKGINIETIYLREGVGRNTHYRLVKNTLF